MPPVSVETPGPSLRPVDRALRSAQRTFPGAWKRVCLPEMTRRRASVPSPGRGDRTLAQTPGEGERWGNLAEGNSQTIRRADTAGAGRARPEAAHSAHGPDCELVAGRTLTGPGRSPGGSGPAHRPTGEGVAQVAASERGVCTGFPCPPFLPLRPCATAVQGQKECVQSCFRPSRLFLPEPCYGRRSVRPIGRSSPRRRSAMPPGPKSVYGALGVAAKRPQQRHAAAGVRKACGDVPRGSQCAGSGRRNCLRRRPPRRGRSHSCSRSPPRARQCCG